MPKIKFVASNENGVQEFPILASKALPSWYTDMPKTMNDAPHQIFYNPSGTTNNLTMRSCLPMFDAMTAGYVAVLPADVQFTKSDAGVEFAWLVNDALVNVHPPEQHPGVPPAAGSDVETIFKWSVEFGVVTPPGYSTLFTHPFNRDDLPFKTFTGIVDTDKYQIPVNFPFRLTNLPMGVSIIPKGTPIAQIVPFRRESFTAQRKVVGPEFFGLKRRNLRTLIKESYKRQYWFRKSYR